MATVVYVPKDERWSNIGQGIGQGVGAFFQKAAEIEAKKNQQVYATSVVDAVKGAPDRKTGLEIIAKATANTQYPLDAKDISTLNNMLDTVHPKDADEPQVHTGYSKVTGQPFEYMLTKRDAKDKDNPYLVGMLTGQDPESITFAKPLVKEYVDPKDGKYMGTFVPGMEIKGTITKDDWENARKVEQDTLAKKRDARAEEAADRADRRLALTERRVAASEARGAKTDAEMADMKKEQMRDRTINTFRNLVGDALNAKRLPDGSLDMSSLDENKRRKYTAAIAEGTRLLDEGKPTNAGRLFRHVKDSLEDAKAPPAASDKKPEAKPQQQGNGGLPAGAKLGDETTIEQNGKRVKARKVLDAQGKLLGYQPL